MVFEFRALLEYLKRNWLSEYLTNLKKAQSDEGSFQLVKDQSTSSVKGATGLFFH